MYLDQDLIERTLKDPETKSGSISIISYPYNKSEDRVVIQLLVQISLHIVDPTLNSISTHPLHLAWMMLRWPSCSRDKKIG